MSNLIPLEDAAKMLGLTVDKMNELRSNSEIFGYKDGASWKFKMQELERVADEFDIKINVGAAAGEAVEEVMDVADDVVDLKMDDDDDFEFDLSDSSEDLVQPDSVADDDAIELIDDDDDAIELLDDDDDAIELLDDDDDEIQLVDDKAAEEPQQEVLSFDDDDDDIQLLDDEPEVVSLDDDDDDISLLDDDDDDDIQLVSDEPAAVVEEEDDFQLGDDSVEDLDLAGDDDDSLSFGSSDIRLAGDEEVKVETAGESTGFLLEDDEDLSAGSDGDLLLGGDDEADVAAKGSSGPGTDDLLGDLDDGSDMLLSEDDLFDDDLQIQESNDDDLELSSDFEESEDLIMDDSDSGLSLAADDDSGLVLEDSGDLDLSGGLMDLAGGDDDDEMIVLDDPAAADAPTDIADDDFNLTPLEELNDEESSGSQVIALEDSDMFSEDSAATMLQPGDELTAEPMLTEDAMEVGEFGGFDSGMPGMTPGMVAPGAAGALPEQPYTLYQILSLSSVLLLLGVGGMVGYDLARNLWLPEDQIITGGVLKMILSLVGG